VGQQGVAGCSSQLMVGNAYSTQGIRDPPADATTSSTHRATKLALEPAVNW
jgi:hypothetical protein